MRDYEGWKKRNPLRLWREAQTPGVSRAALVHELVAGGYRLTTGTLLRWEAGEYDVAPAAMQLLVKITGLRDLHRRWEAWLEERSRS